MALPMPLEAPVTIANLPFNACVIVKLPHPQTECYVPVGKTDCRAVADYLIQWTSDRRALLNGEISP